jgi:hypothetical protein
MNIVPDSCSNAPSEPVSVPECARRAITNALQGPSEAEILFEKIATRLNQLEKC